jgi:selenocysteine lyase/cysteine desulfurase
VAINHASNVAGTLAPAAQAAEIAHAVGVFLLLDVAQTAGVFPIDMASMDVDFLAFTGHKGMQGPPGTGGLVLGERVDPEELASLTQGGTGSRSEIEQQPEFLPDKYESGTSNGVGIAGLGAGIAWIRERGIETIRQHEIALTKRLLEGLGDVPGVTVYGPDEAEKRTAVVSFTVKDRYVSEIGQRLDENFGVLCRVGLHCAPAAHHTLGTFPGGTVRLAPGPMTTMAEIDQAIEAVAKAASE